TKLEGNPLHPSSQGSSGLFEQAALLQLYDPQRARLVKQRGIPRAWKTFLLELSRRLARLRSNNGAGLRFLLEPTASPVLTELQTRIQQAFPASRFYRY